MTLRRFRRPLISRALTFAIVLAATPAVHAGRILFDATKKETAGNADWIIDADSTLNGESNPQRIPTPAQSGITASTPETYWKGALSSWGITMVKHVNTVETLPRTGSAITYGNASNAQDLSHYKTYVVCEPNNLFTAAEKTALMNFVANGGGLYMVADHTISDRDNDGVDSVDVWNDFFKNNGVVNNPFGMIDNVDNISQVSTNVNTSSALNTGTAGTATNLEYNNGSTFTISTAANPSVTAALWTNGSKTNTNVMMAYATYGLGRVVVLGDSSPADDGTGDTGDTLYPGWSTGTNGVLIANGTDWLGASLQSTYDATVGGSFASAAAWTGNVPDGVGYVADFKNFLAADATVSLDRARTVGLIRFDSSHHYTIAGTSTITLAGASLALTGVTVLSGSHTIAAPLLAAKSSTLTVTSASSVLTVGRLLAASTEAWTKAGLGRVDFAQIDAVGSVLTVGAGGMRLVVATPTGDGSRVGTLAITTGATLDLGAGSLAIHYAGGSPLATMKTYLTDGRLNTTAAGLTIGYGEASTLGYTSFGDLPVDSTTLLLRATKLGDANLDATVDFNDLVLLAQHYGMAGDWTEGDFNRSGTVDFDDLVSLAQNYSASTPSLSSFGTDFQSDWTLARSLIPEPSSLALFAISIVTTRRSRPTDSCD